MSFDVFLQRFSDGDAVEIDRDVMEAVVMPLVAERGVDYLRLSTSDGGADLYTSGDPLMSLMISRASGATIWDVVVELARAGGLTILPAGCSTCVTSIRDVGDLPEGLDDEVCVVETGTELLDVVAAG